MVSKRLDLLPELLATLTFLPLGVYMGFFTHFYFVNEEAKYTLNFTEQWPHVVSSVCALVTGLLFIMRRVNGSPRYHFEHFYVLSVGMLIVLIGGIIFSRVQLPYGGLYTIFAGKGICYIAALSYLNIRIGKSRYRMIKLLAPHWIYLFGVAIGATVTSTSNGGQYHYNDAVGLMSALIIVFSVVLLSGYLANEMLHIQKRIDYKRSLDDDINRENQQAEIFSHKYFLISEPRSNAQPANMINMKLDMNCNREVGTIIFSGIGKIGEVAYFYAPFLYMYINGARVSDQTTVSFFEINWYGLIGITISLVMLCCGSYKLHFLLSYGIKFVVLMVTFVLTILDDNMEAGKVVMSIVFAIFGFGYGFSDINILSYTSLKYNELILAIGYSVQYITIGVINYYSIHLPSYIIDFSSGFTSTYFHLVTFATFFLFVAITAKPIVPNRTQISLLEIKNAKYGERNVLFGAQITITQSNNNFPPPFIPEQTIHSNPNIPPGSQVAPSGVIPGTIYPHSYQVPSLYYQQQMQPQWHQQQQQQSPHLAYGSVPEPTRPVTPPPEYTAISFDPSQTQARSHKITEL